jgi:hypothetical protein
VIRNRRTTISRRPKWVCRSSNAIKPACDNPAEAERAVGRELGAHREPATLPVEQELPPGLRALTHPVGQADQLLLAFRGSPDDDQQALGGVLEPGLHVSPSTQKYT